MKKISLASTEFELVTKHMHKSEFKAEANLMIPGSQWLTLMMPQSPAGKAQRPPFATEVLRRIHWPD